MKYISGWQCDNCQRIHQNQSLIWDCPGCGKEVCDSCFGKFAHCNECCDKADRNDNYLIAAANAKGYDFE